MQVRDDGGLDHGGDSGCGEKEMAYGSVLEVGLIGLLDEMDINVYGKGKMKDNVCVCLRVPELIDLNFFFFYPQVSTR